EYVGFEYVGDEAGGVVPAPAVAAGGNNARTGGRPPRSEAITRPRRAMARRWGMRVLSGPMVRWPAARGALSAEGRRRLDLPFAGFCKPPKFDKRTVLAGERSFSRTSGNRPSVRHGDGGPRRTRRALTRPVVQRPGVR